MNGKCYIKVKYVAHISGQANPTYQREILGRGVYRVFISDGSLTDVNADYLQKPRLFTCSPLTSVTLPPVCKSSSPYTGTIAKGSSGDGQGLLNGDSSQKIPLKVPRVITTQK